VEEGQLTQAPGEGRQKSGGDGCTRAGRFQRGGGRGKEVDRGKGVWEPLVVGITEKEVKRKVTTTKTNGHAGARG